MATKIQHRRGTATEWTSANPVLSSAEIGYETDTGKFKIGDGTTAWTALDYFAGGAVVGYQFWNGSSWSARPSGYDWVEAFSDGTGSSTRDAAATAPTGAQDGDRWWKVTA